MAKTTVEELLRTARQDPDFEKAYTSAKQRVRRAVTEALFRLRSNEKLTQTELAERAGWQQPYVSRIERGDAQMITALEGLEAFANAADATTVVLFVDRKTAQVRAEAALGELPRTQADAHATPAVLNLLQVTERLNEESRQMSAIAQETIVRALHEAVDDIVQQFKVHDLASIDIAMPDTTAAEKR